MSVHVNDNVTLASFRELFNINAKTGKFSTSVGSTRGQVSVAEDGSLMNVNRKWNQKKVQVDMEHSLVVRRAFIKALCDDGAQMGSKFMLDVCLKLGLSPRDGITKVLSPDAGVNSLADKPLDRRMVKQILIDHERQKSIDRDIATFYDVSQDPDIIASMAQKRQNIIETFGVEIPHRGTERDLRIELYVQRLAKDIMDQWSNANENSVEKNKFITLFGAGATREQVVEKLREMTDERMQHDPVFASFFSGTMSPQSKKDFIKDFNDSYDISFQLSLKHAAEGNKKYGISYDFIRSADGGGTMRGSTINGEPVEVSEDGIVIVNDENREELESQLGPYVPKGQGEPLKYDGLKSGKGLGIYGTHGGSFAHQILTKLPNQGRNYKNVMHYFTSPLSVSGPCAFMCEEANINKDYGFGSYMQWLTKGVVKMDGGQDGPRRVAIEINEKEIVLKQHFPFGPTYTSFEGAKLDSSAPFAFVETEMRIPLQDKKGRPINTDAMLKYGEMPKGIQIKTSVKTLSEKLASL